MTKTTVLLAALAAGTLLVACNNGLPVAPVVAEQPAGTVSFKADVAPLLAAKCAGCHTPGGQGSQDVQIFDASGGVVHANVAKKGSEIVAEVLAGRMPRNRTKLTATEAGILQKWVASGAANN